MSWTWNRDEIVKARKEHFCDLCGHKIEVGRNYLRRTGFDEGGIGSLPMHQLCELETVNWEDSDWESCFRQVSMPEHPAGVLPVWAEERTN